LLPSSGREDEVSTTSTALELTSIAQKIAEFHRTEPIPSDIANGSYGGIGQLLMEANGGFGVRRIECVP
jgi:hypothetical protein